jgi:hypothetical protein
MHAICLSVVTLNPHSCNHITMLTMYIHPQTGQIADSNVFNNNMSCRIPCKKKTGKPLFAKPNDDEAWVLLLEKAMAKFKVSAPTICNRRCMPVLDYPHLVIII